LPVNPLRSFEEYELFVYSLAERFPSVRRSSLVCSRRGATLARVAGEVHFDDGFRLILRERLVFNRLPALIENYGYEVWRGEEKLFWYDSQPHPDDPALRSTHPHHKHIQPDIKHHRVPAPGMSFDRPNLPTLIAEIVALIEDVAQGGS
jgi:hypothetical protein